MREDKVQLPVKANGSPDWEYIEWHMVATLSHVSNELALIEKSQSSQNAIQTKNWRHYAIGNLFCEAIVKPPVLHARQVSEDENGLPYIVRSKFNNGMKYRVAVSESVSPSPGGVITFGSENSAFFYQAGPFYSGRDIYYIDTRELSENACLFLATCLQGITRKYSYSNGLFPEKLKAESVFLPSLDEAHPDWEYMETFMGFVKREADIKLNTLGSFIHNNDFRS